MSAPHRILFVCHGNICRSTMAEFVMKDLVSRRGMANAFVIGSAATHDDEIGSPVHHGTRAVLEAQGIDCSGKTARRLRRADADEWDLFVGMDEANMRDMRRQLGRAAEGSICARRCSTRSCCWPRIWETSPSCGSSPAPCSSRSRGTAGGA